MDKKLWVLLAVATLTAWCDPEWQTDLKKVKNDTNSQVVDVIKIPDADSTILYDEAIEKWNVYDSLIQKINAPIVSWNLLKPEMTITIDDWCGWKNTDRILDTLAKYNVKATFFIPWDRIRMHAQQRRRAIDEWHQVCCHSYDHHYFKTSEPELLEKQILDWEQAVVDSLWEDYLIRMKRDFPFFRFPWWHWDTKAEHLAVLRKLWYLPFWRSDCTWKDDQKLYNWEIELFHVKPEDFWRISNCIQQAQSQWLTCKPLTETVNPNDWYETPITWKNLRSERRKAKELLKQKELELKDEEN